MSLSVEEFLALRASHPIVDVRSEGEFEEGHISGAINIPLLNNEARAIVGTAYKKKGQAAAIREGFRLVGPRLAEIIQQTETIAAGKEILVHCLLGGMRSSNFCQFAGMAKIKSQILKGGYKAYRQFAIEAFQQPLQILLIGGCTGSGKSEVLRALKEQGEQVVDLETLAHHKGSAFGSLMQLPQPTTEQFHNNLFEEIFKLDISRPIWVEDESITIGKVFLPPDLWLRMKSSPIIQMNVSKDVRVQRLVSEYGHADRAEFLEAMTKIIKRLGGQHFKAAKEKLLEGDMAGTIEILLTYYDKYYLESIESKKDRVKLILPWDGKDANTFAKSMSGDYANR
ncbi:MAG: tRNA 2-selenouridine(34) synthase MnmH [Cyclobacteriaceae bacterium]